ncbi:hypothetical protein TVNIR_1427 [Thioalkalivibrio nitratireducens DSM 14787]|uniref:DUF945 domain-containing protein n=1 Tax=Thioalkalivibrio nitratireducens (strain DSM 14787 / UNIQEM 213 / ALEN2) TaxID=1255043 RepID=L0DXK4_THIND|nr:YdgA family protein [Thioalkalivibrio nitratireducens]AGA33096.1 hypothetical protein TVNIR_1427 [Thioalkalivibrio nitratireducens DSM 14787]
MRKILIPILFLVAVAAAWPVYVGVQVENALREPQTSQLGEFRVHHAIRTYERENYRARASSVLQFRREGTDFELVLDHRIRHRLLGATVKTQLADGRVEQGLPPVLEDAIAQAAPRAETWVGLGGGLSSRLSSRPFRLNLGADGLGEEDALQLELAAGQGGVSYSPERLLLSFDTESASVTEQKKRLDLGQLHYGLLVHPGPDGRYGRLPDYDLSFGVGRLRFGDGNVEVLAADKLQLSAWQNSTPQHLDHVLRMRMERLRSGSLELIALESHLNALRWHRPTILRLLDDLQHLPLAAPDRSAQRGLLVGALFEGLQQMIAHDPVVFGELRLNTEPEKRLRMNLDLGLRGDAQQLATRPLESLAASLEMELGAELIDEMNAWLQDRALLDDAEVTAFRDWLEQGTEEQWIRLRNGILSSRLQLEGGRLMVNGRDQTALLLALVFGAAGGMF